MPTNCPRLHRRIDQQVKEDLGREAPDACDTCDFKSRQREACLVYGGGEFAIPLDKILTTEERLMRLEKNINTPQEKIVPCIIKYYPYKSAKERQDEDKI